MADDRLIKVNKTRHMAITPVGRVSFPQVFTPKSFKDNPKLAKQFKCDLIFDSMEVLKEKYDGKKIKTVSVIGAKNNATRDQWGEDKANWPEFKYPCIMKGDDNTNREGEVYDGYKGKIYISPRCDEKYPPKIVGLDGQPLTEADFYAGCYARAQIIARPYSFGGNTGIRFVLVGMQKVKEGEKFGISSDVFDVSEVDTSENWSDDSESSDDEDEF